MRKRTLGAVVLAGLAVSGAGAFTASNTFSNTSDVAGYGTNTVTGATVTNVHYNVDALDSSKVDSIVFTATEDLTGKSSVLTLFSGASAVVAPNTCANVYTTSTAITCTFTSPESIAAFDKVALTVSQ
jgi:hypothetical protein